MDNRNQSRSFLIGYTLLALMFGWGFSAVSQEKNAEMLNYNIMDKEGTFLIYFLGGYMLVLILLLILDKEGETESHSFGLFGLIILIVIGAILSFIHSNYPVFASVLGGIILIAIFWLGRVMDTTECDEDEDSSSGGSGGGYGSIGMFG